MAKKRTKKIDIRKDAERLFQETGDYRYVALAIGESPDDRPSWAIWACKMAYWFNEQKAAAGIPSDEVGSLLDSMIAFYVDRQGETDSREIGKKTAPLTHAMRHTLIEHGVPPGTDLHDAWLKKLRIAWDKEYAAGTPLKYNRWHILGFHKVTTRMQRHLGGSDAGGLPLSKIPLDLSAAIAKFTKKQGNS